MLMIKKIINSLAFFVKSRFIKKSNGEIEDKPISAIKYTESKNQKIEFRNSSVFQEVVETFKNVPINTIFSRSEIIALVTSKYDRNPKSIIPSDYCYNRLNNGIKYEKYLHLFEYTDDKNYKYLGLDYPYSGKILHKPKGGFEVVVGELKNGVLVSRDIEETHTSSVVEKQKNIDKYTHTTKREIPISLRYKIMKRDNFKCCFCGASPAKDPSVELHIDHIIPWSKGGETTEENLQTLCSKCNMGKSNRP